MLTGVLINCSVEFFIYVTISVAFFQTQKSFHKAENQFITSTTKP